MVKMLDKKSLLPFEIGTVPRGHKVSETSSFQYSKVQISYPSRINAMAIDPARVVIQCDRCFTPGEILFSIDVPLNITIEAISGCDQICSIGRRSLIRHAVAIMRWLTGFKGGVKIQLAGEEYPHCGFGSSGRTIAGVCVAINEMLGNLVDSDTLQRFIAANHGEEISGDDTHLIPVQCIGGAASSGLHKGGIQVLAGQAQLIASADISSEYKITIGFPESVDRIFQDSQDAMDAELANVNNFYNIGRNYGDRIAYRILHELLPALAEKNWATVGRIIEWYRYDLGSNSACSFSHPKLLEWAEKLRASKEHLGAVVCGISSVGPALYAISRYPENFERFFEDLGLKTITTRFQNDRYVVKFKQH